MSEELSENKVRELRFLQNYLQVIQGAQSCLDQKLQYPSLILIYTLIDTLAWASSDKSPGVQKHFKAWVTTWLGSRIPCTPTELFAGRCGILHTLTSEANLTKGGKARRIAYAWGNAKGEDLQTTIKHLGSLDVVAVHIDELFQAVRDAMADMLEKAESDTSLAAALDDAAAQHMVNETPERIALVLAHAVKLEGNNVLGQ